MKKFLLVVFSSACLQGASQTAEVGIQAGAASYWGDLAPMVSLNEIQPAFGIFGRLNFNHTWAMKAELNQLALSGSDANFDLNSQRNLSFRSNVTELNLLLEFNYLKYGPHVLNSKITSYVFAGFGAFLFNPQAHVNNTWLDLRDYRTEGVSYGSYNFSVPFGMGFKYMAGNRIALETQLGFRRTFTDYLDDVSTVYQDVQAQFNDGGLISATLMDRSIELYGTPRFQKGYLRGDPEYKDWYFILTVAVAYRLNTKQKCARFF